MSLCLNWLLEHLKLHMFLHIWWDWSVYFILYFVANILQSVIKKNSLKAVEEDPWQEKTEDTSIVVFGFLFKAITTLTIRHHLPIPPQPGPAHRLAISLLQKTVSTNPPAVSLTCLPPIRVVFPKANQITSLPAQLHQWLLGLCLSSPLLPFPFTFTPSVLTFSPSYVCPSSWDTLLAWSWAGSFWSSISQLSFLGSGLSECLMKTKTRKPILPDFQFKLCHQTVRDSGRVHSFLLGRSVKENNPLSSEDWVIMWKILRTMSGT